MPSKKRRQRISKYIFGIRILPNSARLIYKTTWDNGDQVYETGNFVFGFPHHKKVRIDSFEDRTHRPELGVLLRIASQISDVLEIACDWADRPIPRTKKKERPTRQLSRKKPARIVEV